MTYQAMPCRAVPCHAADPYRTVRCGGGGCTQVVVGTYGRWYMVYISYTHIYIYQSHQYLNQIPFAFHQELSKMSKMSKMSIPEILYLISIAF